jgi:hypothetical protein
MAFSRALFAVCFAGLMACAPRGEVCPPQEGIAALHAAAFHFQHGPAPTAREHLRRARAIIERPGPRATALLERLAAISGLSDREPGRAAAETEHLRLDLGEWACLPAELHERLHAALPALPGTAR